MVLGAAPAAWAVPRILVADLHGQADARELGVGTSVLVAAALVRSGGLDVVPRTDVLKVFATLGLPARDGLWLAPTETRAVCEATRCTQLLVGTLRRDLTGITVTLRLLQHDGQVAKTVRIRQPLRQIALLPGVVTARVKELLAVPAPPPPATRAATLRALGASWIALQKKDFDLAVVSLELAARPTPFAVRFAAPAGDLAALLSQTADSPGAKVRAAVAADPVAALKDAERLADANPRDTAARFLYARALIDAGQAKEALEALKPREGDPEIAEAHFLRGRALVATHEIAKAQTELNRAVTLDGANAEAHLELAESLAKIHDPRAAGEFQKAAEGLRSRGDARFSDALVHAISTDARWASLYGQIDATELTPDELKSVRTHLQEAQARAPQDAPLALARGMADAAGGDAEVAQAIATARGRIPPDATLYRAAAHLSADKGDHKTAAELLGSAYAARPSPALALDAAREARLSGDAPRARELYGRASVDPVLQPLCVRELGELDLEKGDGSSAAERLRKAAALEPDDADIHLKLAQALTLTGDTSAAGAERQQAAALDPDLAGGVPAETRAAPTDSGKPAAPAAASASGPDVPADVIAHLPTLLASFPVMRGRLAEGTVGGTIILGHTEPSPLMIFVPTRRIDLKLFDRGFQRALVGEYHFDRALVGREVGFPELSPETLAQVSERSRADVVLHYTAELEGRNIRLSLQLYDTRARRAFGNEMRLLAPSAVLPLNLLPIELVVGLLLGTAGWLRFRPRGKLVVRIEYDPNMDAGFFSLRLTKLRRRGMGLKGGSELQFVDAVRKKGTSVGQRAASMVGRETEFRLPAGRWWVYLFGVYVKDKKPQGNFLTEKRVHVPSRGEQVAEFNLIPEETSVLVRVIKEGKPVYGAGVWIGSDEHNTIYTNKLAGGALLTLARGIHMAGVRHEGRVAQQQIMVNTAFPMEVTVDVTYAEAVPEPATALESLRQQLSERQLDLSRRAVGSGPPSSQPPRSPSERNDGAVSWDKVLPSSLQGQVYDLETAAQSALQPPSQSSVGTANARRYQIQREIGRGAMGVVYEAQDTILERSVALKVVSQELKNRPDVVDLFVREARAIAALNHPNIVTVYDFGQRGDEYFMALELIHGKTLEEVLAERGGSLPVGEVLEIALGVCAALSYAHDRRVIHRDIKPANIFLLPDGRVKIMDFGLAKVVRELAIKRTMISGTPLYMSPEQIRGTDVDFRADLYSLGCMLYEMLCGSPPFYQGEILYQHTHAQPDPPSKRAPQLPPELDGVLLRCLEKEKENRYPSVAALAEALRELRARFSARKATGS